MLKNYRIVTETWKNTAMKSLNKQEAQYLMLRMRCNDAKTDGGSQP